VQQDGGKEKPYPNNIKYLIKTHGYTIQEVAREIDIPRTTLTDYIVGNRPAPKSCLHKIARVIGCNVEAFHYWPVADISLPTESDDTLDQFAQLLSFLGSESEAAMTFDLTKRKSMLKLLALAEAIAIAPLGAEAWERLLVGATKQPALNTASLEHFERLIGECWKLCDSNELETADAILSSFITKIVSHAHADKKTAFLASHGLRLQSVLAHHRLQIPEKVLLCEQSLAYAREAEDTDTLVAALIELAAAYEFSQHIDNCAQALQEAVQHSSKASPLVQSRAYSNYAFILASMGRKREADFYIHLAQDVFPDSPTLEPRYALVDASVFTLSYHIGLVHLYSGQLPCTPEDFEWYKQHPSGNAIPERLRLEIVNGQAKAAIQEHDLEKYVHFLEEGIIGAVALGSKKRFDEAYTTFKEDMPGAWLDHRDIKRIAEQYHLTHT
jgi:tetratricopeptide (TPR) repeat protein